MGKKTDKRGEPSDEEFDNSFGCYSPYGRKLSRMISENKKIYTVKEIKDMLSSHDDEEGVQFGWVFHGGEKTKEDRLKEMCYDLYHLLEQCELCVKEVAEDRYMRNRNKNFGKEEDARELKKRVDKRLAEFAKDMIEIDCIG